MAKNHPLRKTQKFWSSWNGLFFGFHRGFLGFSGILLGFFKAPWDLLKSWPKAQAKPQLQWSIVPFRPIIGVPIAIFEVFFVPIDQLGFFWGFPAMFDPSPFFLSKKRQQPPPKASPGASFTQKNLRPKKKLSSQRASSRVPERRHLGSDTFPSLLEGAFIRILGFD